MYGPLLRCFSVQIQLDKSDVVCSRVHSTLQVACMLEVKHVIWFLCWPGSNTGNLG